MLRGAARGLTKGFAMNENFETPAVQRIVARQMNRWAAENRAADERRRRLDAPSRPPHWITISREPGAGARTVAGLLRARLGYEVYGRELLDRMAQGSPRARAALERVEDGPHDALREAVQMSLDHAYPGHHAYTKRLVAIASALAARGRVILIGRGLHFVLPRDQGVRVRLVASLEYRVRQVMRSHGCDEAHARRWVLDADRGQNELVEHTLHRDLRDVHAYDMVLDVERLGTTLCADLIESALGAARPSEAVGT